MTTFEWFEFFDQNCHKFKWFFEKWGYIKQYNELLELRDKEHLGSMKTIMNKVWFELPSSYFNIRQNPKGWDQFLTLLEE